MRWIVFLLLSTVLNSSFAEKRTWTAVSGDTIEAEYVQHALNTVTIRTSGGKKIKIPISALSKSDQHYIYLKTPPKLEVSVDDNNRRRSVKDDIDNKKEDLQFEVEIRKVSRQPYPGELKAHLFVLGWALDEEEYVLLEKVEETFALTEHNDEMHSFMGEELKLEHDPGAPVWGIKYKGYLICIKTGSGETISLKGDKIFEMNLDVLMESRSKDRFDRKMRKVDPRNRRISMLIPFDAIGLACHG